MTGLVYVRYRPKGRPDWTERLTRAMPLERAYKYIEKHKDKHSWELYFATPILFGHLISRIHDFRIRSRVLSNLKVKMKKRQLGVDIPND
jgi:hypothetical protein